MLETRKTNLVHTIEDGEDQEGETTIEDGEETEVEVIDLEIDTGGQDNINHIVYFFVLKFIFYV